MASLSSSFPWTFSSSTPVISTTIATRSCVKIVRVTQNLPMTGQLCCKSVPSDIIIIIIIVCTSVNLRDIWAFIYAVQTFCSLSFCCSICSILSVKHKFSKSFFSSRVPDLGHMMLKSLITSNSQSIGLLSYVFIFIRHELEIQYTK